MACPSRSLVLILGLLLGIIPSLHPLLAGDKNEGDLKRQREELKASTVKILENFKANQALLMGAVNIMSGDGKEICRELIKLTAQAIELKEKQLQAIQANDRQVFESAGADLNKVLEKINPLAQRFNTLVSAPAAHKSETHGKSPDGPSIPASMHASTSSQGPKSNDIVVPIPDNGGCWLDIIKPAAK